MSDKATCVCCGKNDSKNKMVYKISLLNDVEKWFHVCCLPPKKRWQKNFK